MITLNTEDAAEIIGVSAITLHMWRKKNIGPPYSKGPGKTSPVTYSKKDLDEWVESRRIDPQNKEVR